MIKGATYNKLTFTGGKKMKRTAIIAVAVLAIAGTCYGFAGAHSGGSG
jgi:hypothetical protein